VALVAALALRLLYQWQASRGPFASSVYLPIDAREYHAWAVAWLAGAWPPPEAFFRPPLYTAFLAAIYRLAGPALVHAIARRLFAAPVPIVATSLCAATGTLIYFDGQLLSASLDVFLGLAIVALLLEGRTRGLGWWLAAGSVLGLSAVNRGAALLQLPLAILWIVALEAWREDGARSAARAARRALALALPVAVAIAPVALYNARYDEDGGRPAPASEVVRRVLSGRAVLIASNSGLNFFLGNHLELRDVNRLDHPGHMASYDRVRLEPTRQGLTSSAAKNAWLVRETLGHIVEAPADWLALMGLKARDLLSGEEIPRNTSIYAERRHSWLLGALLWKWAPTHWSSSRGGSASRGAPAQPRCRPGWRPSRCWPTWASAPWRENTPTGSITTSQSPTPSAATWRRPRTPSATRSRDSPDIPTRSWVCARSSWIATGRGRPSSPARGPSRRIRPPPGRTSTLRGPSRWRAGSPRPCPTTSGRWPWPPTPRYPAPRCAAPARSRAGNSAAEAASPPGIRP
jgi:hypothetical protein